MHDRCLDAIAETATSSDIRLIPPFNADKSDRGVFFIIKRFCVVLRLCWRNTAARISHGANVGDTFIH